MADSSIQFERIDRIIQYALAVSRDRLGPIHLVKYVYLADLKHAEKHAGETFTGVPWVFLHFGPWASEVRNRVEPAVLAIGAERITFTTPKAEGEFVRYRLSDEGLAERLRSMLPGEVASAVRWAVMDHGGDTASLLRHIYLTEPMLRAAPRERLDFAPRPRFEAEQAAPGAAEPELSGRERRARHAALDQRRAGFQRRLREQEDADRQFRAPYPPPKYDDVFFEGTAALDRLAGNPLPSGEGEAVLDPRIWKSPSRSNTDG